MFFRPWGGLSKFFFRAAADAFFGRAASVATCEVSGAINGPPRRGRTFCAAPRGGPVRASCRLSRGICCAAPHGERCSATVHAVSSCVLARVRTAAAARELIALIAVTGGAQGCSTPAALLGLLVETRSVDKL